MSFRMISFSCIYSGLAAKKLEGFFQTGVRISGSSVSIHYENDEDLTRILDLLGLTEKEA